jgi:hypothetical protein
MVKIEDLIDNSDLTILNKNLLFNFVSRAKEQEEDDFFRGWKRGCKEYIY